jgi:hypothetical protein
VRRPPTEEREEAKLGNNKWQMTPSDVLMNMLTSRSMHKCLIYWLTVNADAIGGAHGSRLVVCRGHSGFA